MLSEIANNKIVTENKEESDIWNKLEQYVKNHNILIGTVRELRKYTVNDHEKHVDLVVTMDDYEVIIPEEEVVTSSNRILHCLSLENRYDILSQTYFLNKAWYLDPCKRLTGEIKSLL